MSQANKKRPLNIGLDKMLSKSNVVMSHGDQLRQIPLDLIQSGQYQPRQEFTEESLQNLAASIQSQGILQPIVLRQLKPQQYEIIAGERRWRAAQLAGISTIPALVKEISDQAALAIGLIENIQREDLNALEEANAIHRLIAEFNLTHEEVSKSLGKSRAMVTNLLRLLQLEPAVKTLLERGDLEMGHARALLGLSGMVQLNAAKQVVDKQLSVRETEALVKRIVSGEAASKNTSTKKIKLDANLAKLQKDLSDYLATRVTFAHQKTGSGKMIIEYPNLDILDGILQKLGAPEV